MTVSYQYKVASSTSGGFTRLLFMWRGSLYKLIYRELLLFLLAFDVLSVLYRNLFTAQQKEIFEKLVTYCDTFISLIPLTFILGFYVAYVAARWWQQYEAIPWPDKTMHTIALYLPGNDEKTRIIRRTLMRYLNLTLVLILRSISSAVKKRFPSVDHLTDVGFMTPAEKQMFLSVPNNEFNTYWIPCAWFIHILRDVRAEYPDVDSQGLKLIMEEFNEFRAKCGLLWSYDWISIPLVYTQVVTLATYSFFVAAVIGRQYVEHSDKKMQMEIDIYLPVFTILQFLFFMGLLKVAEQLINPFGDDDEDFELNWLIDRHTKVSYLGVDTLMLQRPPLVKDKYFDDEDLVLPYTEAAAMHKKRTFRGSVHYMQVPKEQQDMYLPEIIEEDNECQKVPLKARRPSLFAKVFQGRAPQVDDTISEKEDISISGSWRPTNATVENDGNAAALKKVWDMDGTSVAHNHQPARGGDSPESRRQQRAGVISPKWSESEGWTGTGTGTGRKKVTKHNSMMCSAGRRDAKGKKEFSERRRKSVPAAVVLTRSESTAGTLSRNSSKWSLRKDSLVDSQWKGIRWKPFVAVDDDDDDDDDDTANTRQHLQRSLRDEVVYVNEGFVASAPDEHLGFAARCEPPASNHRHHNQIHSTHNSPLANGTAADKMHAKT